MITNVKVEVLKYKDSDGTIHNTMEEAIQSEFLCLFLEVMGEKCSSRTEIRELESNDVSMVVLRNSIKKIYDLLAAIQR